MTYKIIKDVEIDKKNSYFITASAQCMLVLVLNRLNKYDLNDENFDIDYDFGMYGNEVIEFKQEIGYSNDRLINDAERFVGKL
jgi:hypothetical protein